MGSPGARDSVFLEPAVRLVEDGHLDQLPSDGRLLIAPAEVLFVFRTQLRLNSLARHIAFHDLEQSYDFGGYSGCDFDIRASLRCLSGTAW